MDNLPQQSNHTGEGEMNNYVGVSRMNPMWPYPHHHIERFPQFRDYFHDAPPPPVSEAPPQQSMQSMVNNVTQVMTSNGGQQQPVNSMPVMGPLQTVLTQGLSQSQGMGQSQVHNQVQAMEQPQSQNMNQVQQVQIINQSPHINQQAQGQAQAQILNQTQGLNQAQVINQVQVINQQVLNHAQILNQGISHTMNHTSASSSPAHENPTQLLTRMRLQDLVREVDPNEQLDEDVEEVLLQMADDFVDSAITAACLLAKHRKSNTVEVKDLQLHLERNWNMWIPGFGTDELRPYKRATVTEAHKQRLTLIRKTLKKY